MSWPVIPGAPHGGPLPTVQVDTISNTHVYAGDSVTIFGSGFSPGTKVVLNPGNILVGTSVPTVTDEITFTVPFGITNIRYVITVSNDVSSSTANIFVIRDVTFSTSIGQAVDVLISEMN